ncbi:MAG: Asp-tRNA(Asn)/Glu-tRNA(Gln) amidotransferase subunit GatA [Alphaproteobacteria bacterium]|jgi:aspartyl-tRNA(Asn)/glutamyl-tRNA(Gln) amidotransferase subunit A|nr:Asp-tRNA(Asn)/Glu-tRNA(Gln) amidotransferase subunit GatA [Alphaproteobacteria bacterium]
MKLYDLTIVEIRDGLKAGKFTVVELVESLIKRAEEFKHLNVFVTETFNQARERAVELDKQIVAGEISDKNLAGVVVGMKDIFCTKGVKTTACSNILENFVPQYESTASQKMLDNGAIFLGKTSLDQFAMGSSNKTSAFGNVLNPYKDTSRPEKDLVPGGSSGGTAAGVAAGIFPGGTATDTGGSVRQPAALCGIVGLKPTYGRVSRWGIIAYSSSLDTPSTMARTVKDAAILLDGMAGHDEKDSTSAPVETPCFENACNADGSVEGLRIGIPAEYIEGLNGGMKELLDSHIEDLKSRGAEIVEISLPHTKYALPAYYIISPAEASANLARYDGVRYGHRTEKDVESLADMYSKTRSEAFGEEVKKRIMIGTAVLSAGFYDAYFIKAGRVRRLITQDFEKAYEKCDVILTPTTTGGAFATDDKLSAIDMYLNDVYTVSINLAGLPAISIPAGLNKNGLPLGLQYIGKKYDEEGILKVASVSEKIIGFDNRPSKFDK